MLCVPSCAVVILELPHGGLASARVSGATLGFFIIQSSCPRACPSEAVDASPRDSQAAREGTHHPALVRDGWVVPGPRPWAEDSLQGLDGELGPPVGFEDQDYCDPGSFQSPSSRPALSDRPWAAENSAIK